MTINPAAAAYATADFLRAAAVQDVDIKAPGPNGELSGKALVVALAGGAAGTPAGGVLTVQGDPAGTPLITNDEQSALIAIAIGSPTDAPWDGVSAAASAISLLKKLVLNTNTP